MKNRYRVLLGMIMVAVIPITGCSGTVLAQDGDTVKVHYTGTLEDGTVFDTSVEREPLGFTLGQGQLIQGFEEAVIGMKVGESKTVNIPVEQAYGPRRSDMIMELERDQLPEGIDPQVGQQLQTTQTDGRIVIATITDISGTTITIDANHPLAGQDLTFEIELVEIE